MERLSGAEKSENGRRNVIESLRGSWIILESEFDASPEVALVEYEHDSANNFVADHVHNV